MYVVIFFIVQSLLFIRAGAGAGAGGGSGEKNTRSRSKTDQLRNTGRDNVIFVIDLTLRTGSVRT